MLKQNEEIIREKRIRRSIHMPGNQWRSQKFHKAGARQQRKSLTL
jgi:hypothetical protein